MALEIQELKDEDDYRKFLYGNVLINLWARKNEDGRDEIVLYVQKADGDPDTVGRWIAFDQALRMHIQTD